MPESRPPNANELLAEALSLDLTERQKFVAELKANHPAVATEVEELLASHEAAEQANFLGSGLFAGLSDSAAEVTTDFNDTQGRPRRVAGGYACFRREHN